SLEDALVVVVVDAARWLSGSAALRFLLAHEPETILPHLAFGRMDAVLHGAAALAGPALAPWLPACDEDVTASRAAEWVARVVISYLIAPSPEADLCDPVSARRLAKTYIVPGLVAATAAVKQSTHHSRGGSPTHA
ncbi:MAG: hypothetical protein ACHQNA_08205, partial [Acidimicrobiales bacterium]